LRWVDEAIDEVKDRHEDEHPPDCEVTEYGDERDDEDADGVDELGAEEDAAEFPAVDERPDEEAEDVWDLEESAGESGVERGAGEFVHEPHGGDVVEAVSGVGDYSAGK